MYHHQELVIIHVYEHYTDEAVERTRKFSTLTVLSKKKNKYILGHISKPAILPPPPKQNIYNTVAQFGGYFLFWMFW